MMLLRSLWIFCVLLASVECKPELSLLHVVFAHKMYAPFKDISKTNATQLPRNLTYDYFNTAAIDMPNTGKLNMFKLGSYLRKTYDKFLGTVYTAETSKMRTAEYPLSILSGQLVNAGLWPPKGNQKWHETLEWQPIPTDYVEVMRDTLLMGIHCPSFEIEVKNVIEATKMRRTIQKYSSLFDYLSNRTGIRIKQISDVALLYGALETKADLNQTLPKWAKDIFPHGSMYNASILTYDILSETPLQRKLNGGTLLKEITGNSLQYIQGTIPKERKIMLYSGNDRSVAGLLKTLGTWSPHIPNEGAAVIFEMHRDNSTRNHYVKVIYYTGTEGEKIPLKLKNCGDMCPLKSFLKTYLDVIPQKEGLLCKWEVSEHQNVTYYYNVTHITEETMSKSSKRPSSSTTNAPASILIVSLIAITFSMFKLA